MKKPKKPKVRKSKTGRNLVLYVDKCSLKAKIFTNSKDLEAFVKDFNKKYGKAWDKEDYWIDLIVTDIKGKIKSLDCIKVYET